MKRKILIIRFGTTHPLPKELPIVEEICGEHYPIAVGVKFHDMGTLSLVYSDLTPQQIEAKYKQVAQDTNDILPVIVSYLDETAISLEDLGLAGLIEEFNESLAKLGEEAPQPVIHRVELSLDDLLDLISSKGMDGLSAAEKQRLQELTNK